MKFITESVSVIVAMLLFGYAWSMPGIWDAPQVHVSNSSNECVRVINYKETDKWSCKNLPELYTHVWVK